MHMFTFLNHVQVSPYPHQVLHIFTEAKRSAMLQYVPVKWRGKDIQKITAFPLGTF